jgi:hypothetical protein
MDSNGKSLTTKVVGLDDTFDLDMWKPQFVSRNSEIWPPKSLLRSQSEIRIDYLPRPIWRAYLRFQESNEYQSWRKFCAIQPGHRICIIWSLDVGDMASARQDYKTGKSERGWFYGNQVPFSPQEDLVQGKVEHAPRLPKGISTTPWVPKEGWSIHPSTGTRRNLGDSDDGRHESSKLFSEDQERPSGRWMTTPQWWVIDNGCWTDSWLSALV